VALVGGVVVGLVGGFDVVVGGVVLGADVCVVECDGFGLVDV
jgi:hypothetical protein